MFNGQVTVAAPAGAFPAGALRRTAANGRRRAAGPFFSRPGHFQPASASIPAGGVIATAMKDPWRSRAADGRIVVNGDGGRDEYFLRPRRQGRRQFLGSIALPEPGGERPLPDRRYGAPGRGSPLRPGQRTPGLAGNGRRGPGAGFYPRPAWPGRPARPAQAPGVRPVPVRRHGRGRRIDRPGPPRPRARTSARTPFSGSARKPRRPRSRPWAT